MKTCHIKIAGPDTHSSFNTETNRFYNWIWPRSHKYLLYELVSQTLDLPLSLRNSCPNGIYILIRKKCMNSVRNSRAYSSFDSILSDHRIVSTTLNLSLRCSKRPKATPIKQVDRTRVVQDQDLFSQHTLGSLTDSPCYAPKMPR